MVGDSDCRLRRWAFFVCDKRLQSVTRTDRTLAVEVQSNPAGVTRTGLRLFRHGSNVPIATQWFAPNVLFEDLDRNIEKHTYSAHVEGGLFILVYHRNNALSQRVEAYARTVYFPEAETSVP